MATLQKTFKGNLHKLEAEVEIITPVLAKQLVETGGRNRKETNVERYAIDMKNGKWFLSGQPILINSNKELVDGFNRCKACIASDSPFIALVVRGVESKAFDVIDIGKTRSLTDLLTMKTDVQYTSIVGYIAKRIVCLEEGREVSSNTPTTRLEEMSAVRQHLKDVEEAAQFARTKLGRFQPSLLAFLYWYYVIFLGNKKAKQFFMDYADVVRHFDLDNSEDSNYVKGSASLAETLFGFYNGPRRSNGWKNGKPGKITKLEATINAVSVIEHYIAGKDPDKTIGQVRSGIVGVEFTKSGVILHKKGA